MECTGSRGAGNRKRSKRFDGSGAAERRYRDGNQRPARKRRPEIRQSRHQGEKHPPYRRRPQHQLQNRRIWCHGAEVGVCEEGVGGITFLVDKRVRIPIRIVSLLSNFGT